MSNAPNPVALTAAMLEHRRAALGDLSPVTFDYVSASLASDLHRLAPACKRHAEAECNGEWWDGQRGPIGQNNRLDTHIEYYGIRLGKRVTKLNEMLAPLALKAVRTGDPRSWTLRLRSTDTARPVPRNGFDPDAWGIG